MTADGILAVLIARTASTGRSFSGHASTLKSKNSRIYSIRVWEKGGTFANNTTSPVLQWLSDNSVAMHEGIGEFP